MEQNKETVLKIAKFVFSYFDVPIGLMNEKTRFGDVVKCRQIASLLSVKKIDNIKPQFVGNIIGGKDRTTVIHSLKTVKNLCSTDKKYNKHFLNIENIIETQTLTQYKISKFKEYLKNILSEGESLYYNPESKMYLNRKIKKVNRLIGRAMMKVESIKE